MAISAKKVDELQKNIEGIPLGKIVCVAKAALKCYKCKKSGGANCIETLIADIEKCFQDKK